MKEALKELLKVKSIITLCVMSVYVYLAISEKLDDAMVSSVITAVITYYFMKDAKPRG